MTARYQPLIGGLALALLTGWGGGALAAEPEQTPTPTRTPIVITNENLADYAAQGHITSVDTATSSKQQQRRPVHQSASEGGTKRVGDAVADAPQMAADEKKNYWRSRYQQQLDLVASIEEQIAILDREIPGLWRQFYAWDDPAYRDGVIKVQLDAALARSERLKEQLGTERARLDEILDEARREGAQPGWFRGLERPATPTPTPGP